jgi:hypothetical protein
MRVLPWLMLAACSGASWTDTFQGQDTRTTSVGDAGVVGDGGAQGGCVGLANSSAPVPITVTFPNHGVPPETIHVVAAGGTCDLNVDSDTDSVIFASDAIPCAKLLAPGTPSLGTVTVFGSSSPSDMQFQWNYGVCTITDDYALSTP